MQSIGFVAYSDSKKTPLSQVGAKEEAAARKAAYDAASANKKTEHQFGTVTVREVFVGGPVAK